MPFYVTTPIYYVNGEPHLGHAYTTIAADILARHMRARGEDVFFLTGTDEHGEPVVQAAERQGLTPRELGDRNAPRFRALMERAGVTNDFFIRTTDPEHEARVQEILSRVHENGHVYKGLYEGWYCPRCADFKTESEIAEGNTCPIHHIALEWQQEENWFFRLSAFQEQLEELLTREDRPFVLPRTRANEALAFVRSGLQDVSLSRSKISWGIPLPWDPEQVFYVWFDALLNYVTALTYARPGQDLTSTFWPATVQLVGKDILKFHAVYWPALLVAAGYEPPQRLYVHGFLLLDNEKISKSLGNVIDPNVVIDQLGADALRYYLFRDVSFGQDGSVSPQDVEVRYETELANEFGNLASRTVAMVRRYCEGRVPDVPAALDLGDLEGEVAALLDETQLTQALEAIWSRVRRLNRYVEEREPWKQAKEDDPGPLHETLASLMEGLRRVTLALRPYLPATTERLLAVLEAPELPALEPLFPKTR